MKNRDLFDASELSALKQEIQRAKSFIAEEDELILENELKEAHEILDAESSISTDSPAMYADGRLNQLFDRILVCLRFVEQ